MSTKSIIYKYISILFAVLLLASLVGNFVLYKKLKRAYLNLYQVHLNPLGIRKYSPQQQPPLTTKSRVVFYGDSRAVQWKAPEIDNFQFINRGIDGHTSAQVSWRFDAHVVELKPSIIVLQVGVNDLKMLPTIPQTREDIVQNCQNNIAQIVARARSIGADIIVTTIFPLGKGNIPLQLRPFWPSIQQMEESINEVNEYIRTLNNNSESSLQRNQVIVLDAYSLLNEEDQNKVKYYKDLLHINQKGYKLLNEKLETILNNLYRQS